MKAEELLAPYIASKPRDDGEQDMHCPLHVDARRSATINFERGLWWCGAGCGGGKILDLVKERRRWVDPPGGAKVEEPPEASGLPSARTVTRWHRALMKDETLWGILVGRRGITRDTIEEHRLGWDAEQGVYTLPVYDEDDDLVNVRFYDMNPHRTRRKIWQVRGHSTPRLYPYPVMAMRPSTIIVCEGEWDALITTQMGFPAVTRTASAATWLGSWNPLFKGLRVALCHDCDEAGQKANFKVGRQLERFADEVVTVRLPYAITEEHGKDLSDFWLDGHTQAEFQMLIEEAMPFDDERLDPETIEAEVLDSFDSEMLGKPLRLTVTVKGRRDPGYSITRRARLECTRDAGEKCQRCPLFGAGGMDEIEVDPSDPLVLELMNSTKLQVGSLLRERYGAVKCDRLKIEPVDHQAVEILHACPSIEHTQSRGGNSFKHIEVSSVGRHTTEPSSTYQVVGALQNDPRSQLNRFMAWDVTPVDAGIDTFSASRKVLDGLRRFRPSRGQRPLERLEDIADGLSREVTRIYGRPEMHMLFDLVWHSVLSWSFDGAVQNRGWLQALVIGDTRTGKSEAASKMAYHYGAGEVITCESASFAGIIGGLQQFGGSAEWNVTWGIIPLNDRRLVVLDEISGLSVEEIQNMSDVRSNGVATLTKVRQDRTYARTRLLMMGNPRQARMRDFTYGVQAVRPLIGAAEDIARFDLAMSVSSGEVSTKEINRHHRPSKETLPSEACRDLLLWAWSRTPEQVVWTRGTERRVFQLAQELGSRYTDEPPLVLPADVRLKIARVAVAMAARLFSTDANMEKVMVTTEHAEDAAELIDRLYSMPGFGYRELSAEAIGDVEAARADARKTLKYINTHPGLAKFLRNNSSFRRPDLEEVLNIPRELANGIINTLWQARMVRKDAGQVKVEPVLHEVLRRTEK